MSAIAEEVGGRLAGPDAQITHVVTDSRLVGPGALFVALAGERTDGVGFVEDALARGATGALVPEGVVIAGSRIVVASTGEALLKLATAERARSSAIVVGITGANGKTTTKDMVAAVLAGRYRTHASPGSFNNEIGLPITILGADPATEVIVAELGARRKGDVTLLCEVAKPAIVVVTNVGVAHIEIFGSWEAIVEASAEPVEAVAAEGWAVLNADDPVVAGFRSRAAGRVVTFGVHADADVRAEGVEIGADGTASFTLVTRDRPVPVDLPIAGEHMVPNALAAAAVGQILGVPAEASAQALATTALSRWRMETFTTHEGVRVINDAYNANPELMAAALKTARVMAAGDRLVAVFGHMAEIGPIAGDAHEQVGDLAARLPVDRLVTVGRDARPIAMSALREGVEPENVASYDDPRDVLADVRAHARAGDVVLVKGSRVTGLESVAEALR
jgi:UDP-N-acetylmuramoyl-tripeptide--D-alanyl-D-alanine ligase